MLLAACTKPSPAPAPAPEHFSKYIFFSHSVETKATLVEKAENIGTFGVVGFKYDSNTDWATYSTTTVNGKLPTPNVFYDPVTDPETQQVTNKLVNVETVSVDGTTAKYTPLQGWSNSKKYAFFAFYPMPNDNVTLVNLDGSTPYKGGVPAVKYTNPSLDKSEMTDVMTAPAYIDKFWKSSAEGGNNLPSGEVSFTLQHRLSALGVKVMNSSDGDITVTSITLAVSGLRYSDMTLPLDYNEEGTSTKTTVETPLAGTFTLSLGGTGQTFETSHEPKYGELSDKLIFIPQSENVTINVTIEYTRSAYDEYSAVTGSKTVEGLITALVEGQKQMISFNFTDSKVDVSISKGPWSNSYEVDNSFN